MDIIVGGGKYGCHSVDFLKQKKRSLVVVDTDAKCLAVRRFELKTPSSLSSDGEYFIHGDLPRALELIDELKPEYIFPTAPVHIAADMAEVKFRLTPWHDAINCIMSGLPQTVVLHAGKGKTNPQFQQRQRMYRKMFNARNMSYLKSKETLYYD